MSDVIGPYLLLKKKKKKRKRRLELNDKDLEHLVRNLNFSSSSLVV